MSVEEKGYKAFNDSASHHIAAGTASTMECAKDGASVFANVEVARKRLNYTLLSSLELAEDAIRRFARFFAGSYNHILWAEDYENMFAHMHNVFKQWNVKSVCFPQLQDANELNSEERCPLYHELGLPYFLQDEKMSIEEEGKMKIFHPDSMLTDSGMLMFNHMNNHSVSMLNNGNINLFIVTVNQLFASIALAELYGEYSTAYIGPQEGMRVLFRGTGKGTNYLIVVDNRRSTVMAHKPCRAVLSCLQCGRCSSVCPVEQTAGKEAYDNVFAGPLASVMLPYLEDEDKEKHVVDACLMCGRCEEVCPLQLPLCDMIIYNRQDLLDRDVMEKRQCKLLTRMAHFVDNRAAMNGSPLIKKWKFASLVSNEAKQEFQLPPFDAAPFNKRHAKG